MELSDDILRELGLNGEVKFEVTLKLVRTVPQESRPARPYDTQGRIDGLRAMAKHIGVGTSTVTRMIEDGKLKVYNIGRKLYAYEDEIRESVSGIDNRSYAKRYIRSVG
jgi:excisionase family DNA binding protein